MNKNTQHTRCAEEMNNLKLDFLRQHSAAVYHVFFCPDHSRASFSSPAFHTTYLRRMRATRFIMQMLWCSLNNFILRWSHDETTPSPSPPTTTKNAVFHTQKSHSMTIFMSEWLNDCVFTQLL